MTFSRRCHGRDRIDQEAVRGGDRLIALLEDGVGKQLRISLEPARSDAVGSGPWARPFASRSTRTFPRIVLQMRRGILVDGNSLRRRPERRLVGRELEDLAARLGHRVLPGV